MKTEDIEMQDDPDKPKNTTFKKALMKRYCKYITCHNISILNVITFRECKFKLLKYNNNTILIHC